ncbi:MAG TPA: hypothetical protein VHS59_10045, partial [Bacillota bacterium]|nr:hypothetical protein [Bacillota bacterium]
MKIIAGEYYSPGQCQTCGGKCCAIYLPDYEGGTYPAVQVYLADWAEYFHQGHEEYGVEPLFNPVEVHQAGNEHLVLALREKGIDPDF